MPDLDDPSAHGTRMEPVFFATGQKLASGKNDLERRSTIRDGSPRLKIPGSPRRL